MSPAEIEVAVISDIHGNRWALEAVLEDIDRRDIREIVSLGDSLYGPLAPAETADMLMGLDMPTVRGNEDRLVTEAKDETANAPTLSYVRGQLTQAHLEWLTGSERTAIAYKSFYLCHGSLDHDDEYMLCEVSEDGVRARDAETLMAMLRSIRQPVLLCGHDHVARTVRLPDGKLIVNPGSVGLPAYYDDVPYPHVMEAGTPEARYSIVRCGQAGWQVENVAVRYNWEAAATVARNNERADWAQWLQSGRASPGTPLGRIGMNGA